MGTIKGTTKGTIKWTMGTMGTIKGTMGTIKGTIGTIVGWNRSEVKVRGFNVISIQY